MQLSINNLPPVGSHFCCIFIGFFLANLSYQQAQFVNPNDYNAILTLPKKIKLLANPGDYVYVAIKDKQTKEPYCFISSSKSLVIQNQQKIILSTDPKKINIYQHLYRGTNYTVTEEKNIKSLFECSNHLTIRYGRENSGY